MSSYGIVSEIAKNGTESVRIELTNFSGHDLIGLRVYARNSAGVVVPTKKGITVRVAMLPAILEALEAARTKAIEAGMLTDGQ